MVNTSKAMCISKGVKTLVIVVHLDVYSSTPHK